MATENCLSSDQINGVDNEKLVRPTVQLQTLLLHAGANKDIFTMKEVIFYLGQYIMRKQLYDKKQQHIVHCANDALGAVLGVDSFSVKEPRVLFTMISKNLVAVKNQDSQSEFTEPRSQSEPERGPEGKDSDSRSSTSGLRRRRSSDTAGTSTDEEQCDRSKRQSSDSHCSVEPGISGSEDSAEVFSQYSDSDYFSMEFEVESVHSDGYSDNDEESVASMEDEVYEVTILEVEEEDSFDENTEVAEADNWKCSKCEELNPPLPRCNHCWTQRLDWFPEVLEGAAEAKTPKPPAANAEGGLDVPDDKRTGTPPCGELKQDPAVSDSQETCSQPSTSGSSIVSAPSSQEEAPELERFKSPEACLPASCLEPCVICQSRPKNGCIVHGRTGHLMACYTCAKKLKNRNKLCPVCREPIQSVLLTYVS